MATVDQQPQNGDNPPGKTTDPGKAGDALTTFLQESVKWPDETGDPNVSLAFLIGWRMWRAVVWNGADDDNDTPGVVGDARLTVLCGQIDAGLHALTSASGDSTLPTFTACKPEDREGIYEQILALLYEKDASLGKAAYLGHQLHGFCSPQGVEPQIPIGATQELRLLLVALATKLPPNAAHSVLNSLTLWEHERAAGNVARTRLQEQGRIWRSFLAGETAAKDALHVSDYIGTADQLVHRVRELFWRSFTGGLAVLWIAVGVLIVAGVLVIALVQSKQGLVTGVSSLVAAFGLTWKGIGQFFGDAVAKAEQALWDSELDWTIAYRSTVPRVRDQQLPARRRTRRADHYKIYTGWEQKWPDMEIDSDAPAPAGKD
jgi:hypothetical protein